MCYDTYICICNCWPLSIQCFCVLLCMTCVLWYVFVFCKYLCLCVHCFCNYLCMWYVASLKACFLQIFQTGWAPHHLHDLRKHLNSILVWNMLFMTNKQKDWAEKKSQFNFATDQENIMIIFLPHQQICHIWWDNDICLIDMLMEITQMVECSALCELPYTNNIQS